MMILIDTKKTYKENQTIIHLAEIIQILNALHVLIMSTKKNILNVIHVGGKPIQNQKKKEVYLQVQLNHTIE